MGENVKASIMMMEILLFFLIYIHLFSCLWWLIVQQDSTWVPYRLLGEPDQTFFYYAETSTKYFISLQASVLCMIGVDIGPRTFIQTLVAGIGCFNGVVVNAFIFSEL